VARPKRTALIIAHNDAEPDFRFFYVAGVARYRCTGCTPDAAYLSVAVTNGRAEFQRRGPFGVMLGREDLSFGGSGIRTSENTCLLGTR
jgi:hypothetical protein